MLTERPIRIAEGPGSGAHKESTHIGVEIHILQRQTHPMTLYQFTTPEPVELPMQTQFISSHHEQFQLKSLHPSSKSAFALTINPSPEKTPLIFHPFSFFFSSFHLICILLQSINFSPTPPFNLRNQLHNVTQVIYDSLQYTYSHSYIYSLMEIMRFKGFCFVYVYFCRSVLLLASRSSVSRIPLRTTTQVCFCIVICIN